MEMRPKYPIEFMLEFLSVDRFLSRISDLTVIGDAVSQDLLERINKCHIYLLAKRPRLSIVPTSVRTRKNGLAFTVEYKLNGIIHRSKVKIPRSAFRKEEADFSASPYPHRELVSYDKNGQELGSTIIGNFVHLFENVAEKARDLEIIYVGKGLRNSAHDRMESHSTLQKILADVNSHEPDVEIFSLIYSFKYTKYAWRTFDVPTEFSGVAAQQHAEQGLGYKPALDEQVSLIEASVISYFKPSTYNTHHLDFPKRRNQLLRNVQAADIAAIVVQLDNTNIGDQRIYSQSITPESTHHIVVDFRDMEGRGSILKQTVQLE